MAVAQSDRKVPSQTGRTYLRRQRRHVEKESPLDSTSITQRSISVSFFIVCGCRFPLLIHHIISRKDSYLHLRPLPYEHRPCSHVFVTVRGGSWRGTAKQGLMVNIPTSKIRCLLLALYPLILLLLYSFTRPSS